MKKQIIVAGGTGFVGHSLIPILVGKGYEVIVLGRARSHPEGDVRHLQWDGKTLDEWARSVDGAFAIVNLTGRSVSCRHTPENRKEILASRVDSVDVLGQAVKQATEPPAVFVQASGVGFYGDAGDRWCDENSPRGSGFMADVSDFWESAFRQVEAPGMRKVVLRLSVVLGRDGGLLQVLGRLTRWFLGGHVGSGRQYISWIHLADLDRMLVQAIEDGKIEGIFNATSPNPVTNAEFMRELRRTLHRPWSPPVPAFGARIGSWLMGTEASLALTGQRCIPKHFLEQGFTFAFPELPKALADIYPNQ